VSYDGRHIIGRQGDGSRSGGFGQAAARTAKSFATAAGSVLTMTIEQLKSAMVGTWRSLAPEVRPSKNPDGTIKPFYLSRRFVYQPGDRFELTVNNYADPHGNVAIAKLELAGHMVCGAATIRSRPARRRSTSPQTRCMR
jgi:hypothetical protein